MSRNSTGDSHAAQQSATQRNEQKVDAETLRAYLFGEKQLTQQQQTALELLLRGLTDAQVAAQLGVDRGTVFRWRKSDLFAQQLDHHRRTLMEQSTARLQTLLDPALDILEKQLAGDDPKTQLRAAAILVRLATPARLRPIRSRPKKSAADSFEKRLNAYVNAPLPDGTRIDDDDLDDELDEED